MVNVKQTRKQQSEFDQAPGLDVLNVLKPSFHIWVFISYQTKQKYDAHTDSIKCQFKQNFNFVKTQFIIIWLFLRLKCFKHMRLHDKWLHKMIMKLGDNETAISKFLQYQLLYNDEIMLTLILNIQQPLKLRL